MSYLLIVENNSQGAIHEGIFINRCRFQAKKCKH